MAVATSYIDFGAFREGQQQALSDQFTQFSRDQVAQQQLLKTQEAMQRLADARDTRAASHFLSTLEMQRQKATTAGLTPAEFLAQTIEQVPEQIKGLSPEAQAKIMESLRSSGERALVAATQAGDLQATKRLQSAFGIQAGPNQTEAAQLLQRGDLAASAAALEKQYGRPLNYDPATNTVTVDGQKLPAGVALSQLTSAGGFGNLYAATAVQTAEQLATARANAQTDALRGTLQDPFTVTQITNLENSANPNERLLGQALRLEAMKPNGKIDWSDPAISKFVVRFNTPTAAAAGGSTTAADVLAGMPGATAPAADGGGSTGAVAADAPALGSSAWLLSPEANDDALITLARQRAAVAPDMATVARFGYLPGVVTPQSTVEDEYRKLVLEQKRLQGEVAKARAASTAQAQTELQQTESLKALGKSLRGGM